MKVLIKKVNFLDALHTIQSVVKKTSNSLYISLQTNHEKVQFTAVNSDTGIKTTKEAVIKEAGTTTLPLRKLYEVIRQSYTEDILIEKKDNKVNIFFGNSTFVFLPLIDFINLPTIEKESFFFSIPGNIFKQMIRKTIFVAPQDERYGINGAYFEIENSNFRVVTTDGYRLAFVEYKLPEKISETIKGIIPNQILGDLIKILKDEPVRITFSKKQFTFNFADTILVSSLIDRNFFDYKKVIEKRSYDKVLKIKRLDLLNSCQRVSIMTGDENNFLIFSLKNNTLIISSSSSFGEAKEELKINYDKQKMEIAFNPQYVIDGIKSFDEEELSFVLSTPESSGVLEPTKKNKLRHIYLMMPIRPKCI